MKQTLKKSAAGVAIHNLGGISNLTYWDGKGSPLAFDTGPANVWIDAAIDRVSRGRHKFDRDGRAAAQGKVDGKAIEKLLAHPYFSRRPPKSTGRDDFPPSLFFSATRAQGNDLVATATELSAQSIARAYHRFVLARAMPLERIYFCGGGAKNSTLLCRIAELLPSVEIFTTTALGADPQYIESQAFAYLGWRALNGIAVGGNWTGAAPNAPSPHLIPGRNWAAVTPLL